MGPTNKFYVYALIDPINRLPFYIGKGCAKRAWEHIIGRDVCNVDKVKRISDIRFLGFEPEVKFIKENMFEKEAYDFETFCIKLSKKLALPVTNKTGIKQPPSRRGCVVSEETRRKISLATKGRKRVPMSEEQKLKLKCASTGKKWSAESKEKLSKSISGRGLFLEKHVLEELRKHYTVKQIADLYSVSINPIKRLILHHGLHVYNKHVK